MRESQLQTRREKSIFSSELILLCPMQSSDVPQTRRSASDANEGESSQEWAFYIEIIGVMNFFTHLLTGVI